MIILKLGGVFLVAAVAYGWLGPFWGIVTGIGLTYVAVKK